MATVLKGYQGNKNPEDPIKDITSTYDPSIMVKKDEPVGGEEKLGKNIRQARQEVKVEAKKDDTSDKWKTASDKLQALKQEKGEMKGWSQRKMARKGLESDVTDILPTIPASGKSVGEERVPKWNIKGELVGYKTKGLISDSATTGGTTEGEESIFTTQQGFGQYQMKEYTGWGSRKHLKAAAKKKLAKGFNTNVSNKKLREALMADEASKKKEVKDVYSKQKDVTTSGDITGLGGLNLK